MNLLLLTMTMLTWWLRNCRLPFAIQSDATVNIQKFDARVNSMYKNLEETFLEFDEDQSGEVDWQEFKKAMVIVKERKVGNASSLCRTGNCLSAVAAAKPRYLMILMILIPRVMMCNTPPGNPSVGRRGQGPVQGR